MLAVAWRRSEDASALLGELLAPLGWDGVLDRDALGAPGSDWLRARGLSVSLTHTAGLAACAVARGGAVGIDAEALDAAVDMPAVAAMQFDAGAARRVSEVEGDERLDRFFRLWALKEAALKALGVGFATSVDLALTMDPALITGSEPAGRGWKAFEIGCGSGHRLAAALLVPPDATPLLIAGELT